VLYLTPVKQQSSGIDTCWMAVTGGDTSVGTIHLTPASGFGGYALVSTHNPPGDPSMLPIGNPTDIIGPSARIALANLLRTTDNFSGLTIQQAIMQLLRNPPTNGWGPLRPIQRDVFEVWCKGLLSSSTPAGGSAGVGGNSLFVDNLLVTADFSSPRRFKDYWLDWLGYVPLCAMAILFAWDRPELWPLLGALPTTDNFTAADATALTTYSANWSYAIGSFDIRSNGANSSSGSNSIAYWNADTFADDQYASCDVSLVGGTPASTYIGTAVRASGSPTTGSGYFTFLHNIDGRLRKSVGGTVTELTSDTKNIVDGDVVLTKVIGSSITWTVNGVAWGATPYTDTSLTSGKAGLGGFGSGSPYQIANSATMGIASTGSITPTAGTGTLTGQAGRMDYGLLPLTMVRLG